MVEKCVDVLLRHHTRYLFARPLAEMGDRKNAAKTNGQARTTN